MADHHWPWTVDMYVVQLRDWHNFNSKHSMCFIFTADQSAVRVEHHHPCDERQRSRLAHYREPLLRGRASRRVSCSLEVTPENHSFGGMTRNLVVLLWWRGAMMGLRVLRLFLQDPVCGLLFCRLHVGGPLWLIIAHLNAVMLFQNLKETL